MSAARGVDERCGTGPVTLPAVPGPNPGDHTTVPAETHVERAPLDRQQVFEMIRDRLADILEVEPSTIHEGDSFTDDLEADSLALIELARDRRDLGLGEAARCVAQRPMPVGQVRRVKDIQHGTSSSDCIGIRRAVGLSGYPAAPLRQRRRIRG